MQSDLAAAAIARFKQRRAVIGIVGLGYVGQPLALCFGADQQRVIGFDIDKRVVDLLNSGKSNIRHIDAAELATARANGFVATTDYQRIAEVDCIVICVPTPLNRNREPDMSYVRATMQALSPHLHVPIAGLVAPQSQL